MGEWLEYPANKPKVEGRYVVFMRHGVLRINDWCLGEWTTGGVESFLPTPIPEYEPAPEPTVIEWERIPEGDPRAMSPSKRRIVLHCGRAVAVYLDTYGTWYFLGGKALDPQPQVVGEGGGMKDPLPPPPYWAPLLLRAHCYKTRTTVLCLSQR